VRNNTTLWQLFVKLMLTSTENETFEALESILSYLYKAFWSAIQDSHFERNTQDCLGTMQITSQLIDGGFFNFISVKQKSFFTLPRSFAQVSL
jgi:hypothetical protein